MTRPHDADDSSAADDDARYNDVTDSEATYSEVTHSDVTCDDAENPAAAVSQTLRELGRRLDTWAVDDAFAPGETPLGVPTENTWLLASLAVDAALDTNATLGQRSLREFLR